MSLQIENGDEESDYIGDVYLEDAPPNNDDDAADESDAGGDDDDAEQLNALARLLVQICKRRGIAVPFDPGNPTIPPSSEVLVSDVAQDAISAVTDATGIESAASRSRGSAAPRRRRRASGAGLPAIGEDSSGESAGRRPSSGGRMRIRERAERDQTRQETDYGARIKNQPSSSNARSPSEVEADIEMNVSSIPPADGESRPSWKGRRRSASILCALVALALLVALSVSLKRRNVPSEEPSAKLTAPTKEQLLIDLVDQSDLVDAPSSPSKSPSTKLTVTQTDEPTNPSAIEPFSRSSEPFSDTPAPHPAPPSPTTEDRTRPPVEHTAAGESSPPCANTPGYVDVHGDGCGYYEAEANYPRACRDSGTIGPNGETPNENCCACKENPKRTPATPVGFGRRPAGETDESSSPGESPSTELIVARTDERTSPSTSEPSRIPTLYPTLSPTDEATRLDHRPCDTPGYVDVYGDGCAYYEADENFPQACRYFGTSGPNGKTPNENCCACKDYSKRTRRRH